MRPVMALCLAGVVSGHAHAASAQLVTDMTPERIEEAISQAKKAETCYPLQWGGGKVFGMSVRGNEFGCFTTPYSRVVQAAQAARKKYKQFTAADVTPDLIASEIHVFAFPQTMGKHGEHIVNVTAAVVMPVKSKDRSVAIQPVRTSGLTTEYKNLLGATWEGSGLLAVFPLSVLSESNEVRLVYDDKIGSCGGFSGKDECAVHWWKFDKIR